jgi:hypothetical protein
MKTGAMRRFVGIDLEGGSEPGKAMRVAKKLGHGIESVSCDIACQPSLLILKFIFYDRWHIVFPFHLLVVSSAS